METTLYHKNTLNNSPESHPDCSEKKGKQHEKKKKRMLSIAGMCCCGFLAAATAISGSSAYQTDHDEVVNIIRTGNNTIIPDEDFPTPTPVPSSGSVVKKSEQKYRRCTLLCPGIYYMQ